MTLFEAIRRGLLLGLATGLVVSMCESVYMLRPGVFVPSSYPLAFMGFNLLVWSAVGCAAGLPVWIAAGTRRVARSEPFYWVLFFLVPFAAFYGILGMLPIREPMLNDMFPMPVFDHYASFVWVGLLLVFLAAYYRKNYRIKYLSPLFFVIETGVIAALFHCCSNMGRKKIYRLCSVVRSGLDVGADVQTIAIILYAIVVVCIGITFFVAFFRIKPAVLNLVWPRERVAVIVLLAVSCVTVGGMFVAAGMMNTAENKPSATVTAHEQSIYVPHVILIVLDTLRADRLSVYNEKQRGVSNNLQEFSRNALVFEQCVAPAPWTLPSHVSLFTGWYPSEHRCISFTNSRLSDSFVTLAEIFEESGYATCAIVSNWAWLNPSLNTLQGFQVADFQSNIGTIYRMPFKPSLCAFSYLTNMYMRSFMPYRMADDINRKTFGMLEGMSEQPFFLFLNYMDTHSPHRPPKPFDRLFLEKAFPQFYRLQQYYLQFGGGHDTSGWNAYITSQYDGDISYLDMELGKLFGFLKAAGMYDDSLIIVTSDHGELLGEHGIYGHGAFPMYEGLIRVPLIIKYPFQKRVGREKNIINVTDIYSTILDICRLRSPRQVSGRAFGGGSVSRVAELLTLHGIEHRVMYDGKYKLMRFAKGKRHPELYDLSRDPLEKDNIIEKLPAVAASIEKKLESWKQERDRPFGDGDPRVPLPEDLRDELKALGYVK